MYMYIYTYAHIYTSSPNIGSSNPFPKYIPENRQSSQNNLYTNICSSFIHNIPKLKITQITGEWTHCDTASQWKTIQQ